MTFFSDFETSTKLINNKVNVYLWGLVSMDNSIREYNVNLDTFFDYIFKLKDRSHEIYFHNLSWDGVFIVHWLVDNDFVFKENLTKGKKEFTWICDLNTNIYSITIKYKSKKFKILDSLKLLPTSVKKLGENINFNKLELEYENYDYFKSKNDVPEKVVEYLFRDIDIVKLYMDGLKNKYSKIKTTISSTVYSDFKKYYGRYNFFSDFVDVLTENEWNEVKQSYNGGFTAISPIYKNVDLKDINGYSYDWNSMYPSVMLKYKLPYGSPMNIRYNNDDIELWEVRIINAKKIDERIPDMLPNPNSGVYIGKYLSEAKDITIRIWSEEFEKIKENYKIEYIIVSKMYFKSKYIFKDYINIVKDEKINAKTPIDKYFAKIKQNSIYGKFGQNLERKYRILVNDITHTIKGKRYGSLENWVEVEISKTDLKNMSYIPIASYITSKARTLLFDAIYNNRENFLYTDTDSLYLKDVAKGIDIDDNEYGNLKLEHRFNRFKALKSKCYIFNDINTGLNVRVAGLPDNAQKMLNFDNFNIGFEIKNVKLQKRNYIGGLILEKVDYTL